MREQRRAEVLGYDKALDGGATARNCRETTPGGVSNEVNDICDPQPGFPKGFFSLEFGNHLKSSLFYMLIGEWHKGPHSISSSHSNSTYTANKPLVQQPKLSHTKMQCATGKQKSRKRTAKSLVPCDMEMRRSKTRFGGKPTGFLFAADSPITKAPWGSQETTAGPNCSESHGFDAR